MSFAELYKVGEYYDDKRDFIVLNQSYLSKLLDVFKMVAFRELEDDEAYILIDWLLMGVYGSKSARSSEDLNELNFTYTDRSYLVNKVLIDCIWKYKSLGYNLPKIDKFAKKFILGIKIMGLAEFKEVRGKDNTKFTKKVLINFFFKKLKEGYFLESFLVYSKVPYQKVTLRIGKGKTVIFITNNGFFGLRSVRIYTPRNKNTVNSSLDATIKLSQTPISINQELVSLVKSELVKDLEDEVALVEKTLDGAYEFKIQDLLASDYRWWSEFLSLKKVVDALLVESISSSRESFDLNKLKAELLEKNKVINEALRAVIEVNNWESFKVATLKALIVKSLKGASYKTLVGSSSCKDFTEFYDEFRRGGFNDIILQLRDYELLKKLCLDREQKWKLGYFWKEHYFFKDMDVVYKRLFSKVLTYHIVSWLLDYKEVLYVPHIFDFRGRIYSDSLLSPIYNKVLRPILQIGEPVTNLEKVKTFKYYYHITKYLNIFNLEDYCKTMIELEVGKLFIKTLVSSSKPSASLRDLATLGKSILMDLSKHSKDLDLADLVYLKVLNFYHQKINKDFIPKYIPLLLDSTASGQQMLCILLEKNFEKDKKLLTYLNLGNNRTWYDIYYLTLRDFIKFVERDKSKELVDFVRKYFTRKVVKRAIMTSFYNATSFRVSKTIYEALEGTNFENEEVDVQEVIKLFYQFLTKDNLKDRFGISSLTVIVKSEKFPFDSNYYEVGDLKEERVKIKYKGRLYVMTYNYLTKFLLDSEQVEVVDLNEGQDFFTKDGSNKNNHFVSNTWNLSSSGNILEVENEKMFENSLPYKLSELGGLTKDVNLLKHSQTCKEFNACLNDDNLLKGSFNNKYVERKVDLIKTQTALAPNVVHRLDSDLASFVIVGLEGSVYTVHDMYITNLWVKAQLYDSINNYFNEKLKTKSYSLTVVI